MDGPLELLDQLAAEGIPVAAAGATDQGGQVGPLRVPHGDISHGRDHEIRPSPDPRELGPDVAPRRDGSVRGAPEYWASPTGTDVWAPNSGAGSGEEARPSWGIEVDLTPEGRLAEHPPARRAPKVGDRR